MTSVSFGDKPAGNIAITALHETAKMGERQYPEAAEIVLNNSYVDDITDSIDTLAKATRITREIDKLIGEGGFQVKEWIMSSTNGDSKDETFTKGVGKNPSVLGLTSVQSEDVLKFVIKLNFSPKKRGIRCEPDLIKENLPHQIPTFITKRLVLSQVNGIDDPLGLITPFTVVAKIFLRELWKRKLDWDEDVGEDDRAKVIRFFTNAFELEDISFERCMKPTGSVGDPVLITFCDASINAFGACSYFR